MEAKPADEGIERLRTLAQERPAAEVNQSRLRRLLDQAMPTPLSARPNTNNME